MNETIICPVCNKDYPANMDSINSLEVTQEMETGKPLDAPHAIVVFKCDHEATLTESETRLILSSIPRKKTA